MRRRAPEFISSIIPSVKQVSIISRNLQYQATFIDELKAAFPDLSFQGADQSKQAQVQPAISSADIIVW